MDLVAIIIMLATGAIAGWLAGLIYSGAGFGPLQSKTLSKLDLLNVRPVPQVIFYDDIATLSSRALFCRASCIFRGSSARSSPTRLAPSFCCF